MSEMSKVFDLSELPDELIANILSRLTLKDAASTSVISPRWKDLWKLYSGCFDFDGFQTFVPSERKKSRTLLTERNKFVDWVNYVFQSHKGATIQGLRIIFNLKTASYPEIDKWIQLALAKNVEFIELDLSTFDNSGCFIAPYEFPVHSHRGFQSLKTLCLTRVNISAAALETLLDNSPSLEKLVIVFSLSLTALKLSSVSLKYLSLFSCGDRDHSASDIKISAPKLLSFTWCPFAGSNLVLEDVPKLTYVRLGGIWPRLDKHYSQLHELVLSFYSECACKDEHRRKIRAPELSNLRYLTMTRDSLDDHTFCHFVDYLNAAPLLENFTIRLSGGKRIVKLTEALLTSNHCYKNLKTVKCIGFGAKNDFEFLRYLLDHAPLLKKITIDACRPHYIGTYEEVKYRQTATYQEARERAKNFCASISCHLLYNTLPLDYVAPYNVWPISEIPVRVGCQYFFDPTDLVVIGYMVRSVSAPSKFCNQYQPVGFRSTDDYVPTINRKTNHQLLL
ncbi:hypothetical protein ACFE04_002099 [Oxalis oulophora]